MRHHLINFFQIRAPQTAAGLSVEGGMGLSGALIKAVFDEVNAHLLPSTYIYVRYTL